jgi:hypothetical protein
VPDLDLDTAQGASRIFSLLRRARPVLLNLSKPGGFDIARWSERVQLSTQLAPANGSFQLSESLLRQVLC